MKAAKSNTGKRESQIVHTMCDVLHWFKLVIACFNYMLKTVFDSLHQI